MSEQWAALIYADQVLTDNGDVVADVYGRTAQECDARKAVIAAAPELLAVLHEAEDKLHVCGLNLLQSSSSYARQDGECLHKVRDLVRAAIRKAEGRSDD